MSMPKIASKTFTADLIKEGSWGMSDLGRHESTMDYYREGDKGFIEWDIPSLETTEEIGLWFDGNELVDYDGVFSLPDEAIVLLRENGVQVGPDFE